MTGDQQALSIEEILEAVRVEAKAQAPEADQLGKNRRLQNLSIIPVPQQPDDGDALPLNKAVYSIEEFSALDDGDFLSNAYRILLGREVDAEGSGHYLPALQKGRMSRVRVLSALSRSAEGQERGIKIAGLLPASILDRLAGLSGIGRVFEPFMQFLVRSTTNQRLAILSKRHNDLIMDIESALSAIRKNQTSLDMRLTMAEKDADLAQDHARIANNYAQTSLSELQAIRHEVSQGRSALGRYLEDAKAALPKEKAVAHNDSVTEIDDLSLDSFYVAFENKFRGSQKEITERSKRYLPLFRENPVIAEGNIVLDIGCGRGEFLALLRDHNITPRGIDLNSAMVEQAKSLDLDVLEGDALSYLSAQPDNNLGAISGFHIVEHIDFRNLVRLFDEALRVLQPGGFVLFETPNPENLVVGACTFHYDPTHIKPIPPDYLQFVAQARGFGDTRIIRADQDCDLSKEATAFEANEVNDWFRQPADYALYAQKPTTDEPV